MALTRPKYSQIYDSDFKNSARVATLASVTLSGGAPDTVDDIGLSVNDRVLVRAQATVSQNGIYRVSVVGTGSNGTWVRTLDADSSSKLSPGSSLSIEEGTDNGGKLYRMTAPGPITLGSSDIIWTDVSGGGGATTGGTNGQVQFNLTNNLGGATYLYYNTATGRLTANAGTSSTSSTNGTVVVSGGVGVSGNIVSTGTIFATGGTDMSAFRSVGYNNRGGTGYHGFLDVTNTYGSATNPSKFFRLGSDGSIEIINSAYTQNLFTLTDAGQLYLPQAISSTSTSTGTLRVGGGAGIAGELNVGANVTVTGNVLPSANVTYNLGSPSQRWKDLYLSGTTINLNGATISAASGAITFQNSLGGSFSVTGSSSGQSTGTFGNLVANSGAASSSTSTGALVVTGGAGISGALNVGGDITVSGGLTVNGTTTNINTTNLVVEDKNIIIADVATPTDTTADGAGITVKGSTDKTFTWVDATNAWTSSEDLNLLTGKQYEINGTSVLTATTLGSGVFTSNLTTLGNVTSLLAITAVATNFSTGNAVITGGSLNGTTVGATTHTTGRFTTVTATTVNAGTIGNASATITGGAGTLTSLGVGAITSSGTIIASTVNAGTIGNSGATLTGTLSTAAQTNVTSLGTLTGLTVSGAIVPNANLTINVGSTSAWFNTFYGVSTQAKYADLAENYQADAQYVPGTVLVFGGAYEVTTTDRAHNTAVAGIVSTNPAHLMNGMLVGHGVVAVGLTGRLPCRVQGPVAKGDVLVTSTTPGVAQRIDNTKFLPGCVVGKALESINTNNIQTIEVVVGRF